MQFYVEYQIMLKWHYILIEMLFEQKISTDKLNVPRAYKYQKLSKNRWSNKK